jgi:immunity protein 26 of polymorphic toxin system
LTKGALKQLLDRLDEIFEEHAEVGDTHVRERMAEAIHRAFVAPQGGYTLPTKFGMFTRAGDRKVRGALQQFLDHPEVIAATSSLQTPEARLAAFQDLSVTSAKRRAYDEYFGHASEIKEMPEEPAPIQLTVLKKSRRAPQPGDIFVMLPPDGLYLYGRVVKTDADMGFGPCNLIYVYRARSKEKTPVPELLVEELLIPPVITENSAWTRGYFEFLENRPLTVAEQLPQHCFRDDYVHRGRHYDEYGNPLPDPIEPVGTSTLTTVRGIAKRVSRALGIPIPPD